MITFLGIIIGVLCYFERYFLLDLFKFHLMMNYIKRLFNIKVKYFYKIKLVNHVNMSFRTSDGWGVHKQYNVKILIPH